MENNEVQRVNQLSQGLSGVDRQPKAERLADAITRIANPIERLNNLMTKVRYGNQPPETPCQDSPVMTATLMGVLNEGPEYLLCQHDALMAIIEQLEQELF